MSPALSGDPKDLSLLHMGIGERKMRRQKGRKAGWRSGDRDVKTGLSSHFLPFLHFLFYFSTHFLHGLTSPAADKWNGLPQFPFLPAPSFLSQLKPNCYKIKRK